MITNNEYKFRCECCGTTDPIYNEEVTVTLIGQNGVEFKKVCYTCAEEIRKNNPLYLRKKTQYLHPYCLASERDYQARVAAAKEEEKKFFTTKLKTNEMVKRLVGIRRYEGFVDITDPCYGGGSNLGMRLPITTGEYTCVAWELNYDFYSCDDHVVYTADNVIGIYKDGKIPRQEEMVFVGTAGIDSGLIGVFDVKEDLNLSDWLEEKLGKKGAFSRNASIVDVGFMTSPGDLTTKIYIAVENYKIVAVEIRIYDYSHRGQ